MGRLSAKFIEHLTKPGTYEDGDGLRLVVTTTGRKNWVCSGLMKPDTHLGENARHREVSDDQATSYLYP